MSWGKRRNYAKKEEVIKLLHKGWEIFTNRNEHTGKRGQLVYSSLTFIISNPDNNEERNIHCSTIYSLQKDKIIGSRYLLFAEIVD